MAKKERGVSEPYVCFSGDNVEVRADSIEWKEFGEIKPIIQAVKMSRDFYTVSGDVVFHGKAGDWLVKGEEGGLYPRDADWFERDYEAVEG
jgi:hypothetical protein